MCSGECKSIRKNLRSPGKQHGDVYLARPGAPLLEVSEEAPHKPATLAPVVERIRIRVSPEVAANLSCLGIPELAWTTTDETAIQVGGKWRQVDEFV